ncbi:MAG: glycosyltransferase family 4 protein [Patescibacteria group bacterium]
MKICVVAYKFGTEKEIGQHLGTYHYFIEILRQLVVAGHEVTVIAPWLSFKNKGSEDVWGIKVSRYYPPLWNKIWAWPINRLLRFWYIKATQNKVIKHVKQAQPQVIIVWQARETGYALAQIKDKLNVPLIFRQITTWQWHFKRSAAEVFGKSNWYNFFKNFGLDKLVDIGLEFLLDKKTQKKYAEKIYQQFDKIAFVSKIASQEGITMGLPESKVSILPVCIETEVFRPLNQKVELRQKLGLSNLETILFIGRINFAEKGIGHLVQALPEVISAVPNVQLVIIGAGGEYQRLTKLIADLKISEHIVLAGKKPFDQLVEYINAGDVFVMPSLWLETFGQVTIEAMACAVPVITFDTGASPEINIDNQTGLIVKEKTPAALAQAIIKLLKDNNLSKDLGSKARQRVLDNYTYQVVVNDLLAIIKQTENGKRKDN